MADQGLLNAFNECIERRADGQSIDDCLRRYPQYAQTLRPMLEVGSLIERTQASSFEIAAAQTRVRARINERMQTPPRARRSYAAYLALAASLLIALAAVFGTAENSLPGDPLYGVKRFSESVRSGVIGEQFGGRRLDEIRRLEGLKRAAQVEFTGIVQQINGTAWNVAGLAVHVNAGTSGADAAGVGDQVQVDATTTDQGELIAEAIQVLEKTEPTPLPTRQPTSTPTLILTPAPTTCTAEKPTGWVRYVIQTGDTVGGLASVTGTSTEQIVTINCLPETLMIVVGQTLFLPNLPVPATATTAPELTQPSESGNQPDGAPTQAPILAPPTDDHGGGQDSGHSGGDSGSGDSGSDGHSGGGSGSSGSDG